MKLILSYIGEKEGLPCYSPMDKSDVDAINGQNVIVCEIKAGKSFVTTIDGQKYMACPVKYIEKAKFNEPVYDLTVEGDESYIADGIAVHNCSVEYSVCNICGNKAEKTEDYCTHIRNR